MERRRKLETGQKPYLHLNHISYFGHDINELYHNYGENLLRSIGLTILTIDGNAMLYLVCE